MITVEKDLSIFKRKEAEAKSPLGKISVLTAYDFNTAKALDQAGIDCILVGDSLAMVALGYKDTTQVTPEEMLTFTKAVLRGAPNSVVIADIPLLSVKKDFNETIEDCKKFIAAGADMIKIENAEAKTLDLIKELKKLGIKTMAHIGYTPQSPEKFTESIIVRDETKLLQEAKALEEAGAVAIVLEMIPDEIAEKITESTSMPTIGIGAGLGCDGQVLVTDDMLGRFAEFKPKFVKRYAEQHKDMLRAFNEYMNEVQSGQFPAQN